ncbi:SUN domain-containing protein 2-like isoform X2 [Leucoraja erinacea]|uniref:SUN domain-containing protein 2-like isoform X2 n=1 Tax=Leucoraja erinaceus TaxID=7782 RepID=UPI0024589B17|nr:SUN domain-containing protein 2-like isoform X2 [Leucoraja erinacea]XP_055487599.1 SUN domain-containing protein 2-like isoform X2 [Leucoraja erinacea]
MWHRRTWTPACKLWKADFKKETVLLPLVHKLLFGSSQDSTGEPLTAQLVHHKELDALLAGLEKILSDASLYPGTAMEAHSTAVRAGIIKNKDAAAFKLIEQRVNNNWGHPEYTCLYRFCVHGEAAM